MNKTKKSDKKENCMSDFLSSPFSTVMETLLLAAVLEKVHH